MENHQQEKDRDSNLPSPVITKVGRNGTFRTTRLSPCLYQAVYSAPGCQSASWFYDLRETKGVFTAEKVTLRESDPVTDDYGIEYVWVPEGQSIYGRSVTFGFPDKIITIEKGFYMSKTELSIEQYRRITGRKPVLHEWERINHPVRIRSFEEVQELLQAMNTSGDESYRIPTSEEWEHACRATTRTTTYFPLHELKHHAVGNYTDVDGGLNRVRSVGFWTRPCGSLMENPWGLHDMNGNVSEYTSTDYKYDKKVTRGGSQLDTFSLTSSSRIPEGPRGAYDTVGVRLIYTPKN